MTKYFQYMIQNIEPLRIADDSSSQSGQTISLKYIPGTAIRGLVINSLAGREDFEQYKKLLFSINVKYLNAFLYDGNKELLPSLKGFYEDKTSADENRKKKIENGVINSGHMDNYKRASLGCYCAIEDSYIYYYKVKSGSDMKIKIGEKKVFRNEYMMPGYQFVGYIALDDEACNVGIPKILSEIFKGDIYLGNGRSQGLGKCKVIKSGMDQEKEFPYEEYSLKSAQGEVYMMLLSNTTMRNKYGEYCGLDLEYLKQKLQINNLEIFYCSSSTVNVKGYNRTWGIKIPSVTMYEQGSIFYLKFDGIASAEALRKLMHTGIGIRRNEGFGRILFLDPDKYKKIKYKKEGVISLPTLDVDIMLDLPQNQQVLRMVAKKYYKLLLAEGMQKNILSGVDVAKIPNSQVGAVRALLEKNQYKGEKGIEEIKNYFEHAYDKEKNQRIHKTQKSIAPFMNQIINCLDASLDTLVKLKDSQEIMGINTNTLLTDQEQIQMKFQYLLDLIRYENRTEVQ